MAIRYEENHNGCDWIGLLALIAGACIMGYGWTNDRKAKRKLSSAKA